MINSERVGFGEKPFLKQTMESNWWVTQFYATFFSPCNPLKTVLLTLRNLHIHMLGLVPCPLRCELGWKGGRSRVPIWMYIVVISHQGPFPFLFETPVWPRAGGSVVRGCWLQSAAFSWLCHSVSHPQFVWELNFPSQQMKQGGKWRLEKSEYVTNTFSKHHSCDS